ncbi:hypothetical protein V5E97_26765 [Singulisphaera sp. Ch08]|uniref:Uncharacterized protein n=1 Tax=Singulisphaera sp. Ch08 TaxID=3120278 RepID=A0AAU7C9L2_9BACT
MMGTLRNLFVEMTTTVAVVVALTLVGFGLLEATQPRMVWSGSRRERHLIGCPACLDTRLPIEEQLRCCPEMVDLQRQLLDRGHADAEDGPATVVAGLRLALDRDPCTRRSSR